MKKYYFSLLFIFVLVLAGCKQNFLQSSNDDNMHGFAKVCVTYEDSDRAVFPAIDEFTENVKNAEYTLLCDGQSVVLDSDNNALIPYGNHNFTLFITSKGSVIFKGYKSQTVNKNTTNLTFSLSDSNAKGSLSFYLALYNSLLNEKPSTWFEYNNITASVVNINKPKSSPIVLNAKELPKIVKNDGDNYQPNNHLYYLKEFDFDNLEAGTYLISVKGEFSEKNSQGSEVPVSCTFCTDKVVIKQGLVSSNKNNITYFNPYNTENSFLIKYEYENKINTINKYYPDSYVVVDAELTKDKTFVAWFKDKELTQHLLNQGYDFVNMIGDVILYPKYFDNKPLVLYEYDCNDDRYHNVKLSNNNRFYDWEMSVDFSYDLLNYCLSLRLENDKSVSYDGLYTISDKQKTKENILYYSIDKNLNFDGKLLSNPVLNILIHDSENIINNFYVDNLSDSKQILFYIDNTESFYLYKNFVEENKTVDDFDINNELFSLNDFSKQYLDNILFYSKKINSIAIYENTVYFSLTVSTEDGYLNYLVKYEIDKESFSYKTVDVKDPRAVITDLLIIIEEDNSPSLYALVNKCYDFYTSNCGYLARIDMDKLSSNKPYGLTTYSEDIPNANNSYYSKTINRPASTTSNEFFGPHRFIGIKPKKLIISDSGYFYWDITDYINGNAVRVERVVEYDLDSHSIDVFDTDCEFVKNINKSSFYTPQGDNIYPIYTTGGGSLYENFGYKYDK